VNDQKVPEGDEPAKYPRTCATKGLKKCHPETTQCNQEKKTNGAAKKKGPNKVYPNAARGQLQKKKRGESSAKKRGSPRNADMWENTGGKGRKQRSRDWEMGPTHTTNNDAQEAKKKKLVTRTD